MKKPNFKAAAEQALGSGIGAVAASMLSTSALPTMDPNLKSALFLVGGALLSATQPAGSALASAGNGISAVGALELAKNNALISGIGRGRYRRVGQPTVITQLPTIGRDGQNRADGIFGVGSGYTSNIRADFNSAQDFNSRADFS